MNIKLKSFNSLTGLIYLLIVWTLLFLLPLNVFAAEILQINKPNTILVGDQNRTLSIKLFCTLVDEKDEIKAVNLLKKNFPRGTKVKIKPYGLSEEILLAKIYKISDDIEMTNLLNTNGLSKSICND